MNFYSNHSQMQLKRKSLFQLFNYTFVIILPISICRVQIYLGMAKEGLNT